MAVNLSFHNASRFQEMAGQTRELVRRPVRGSDTPFGRMMSDSVGSSDAARGSSALNRTDVAVIRRSVPAELPSFESYHPARTESPAARVETSPIQSAAAPNEAANPGRFASSFQAKFLEPDNTRFNKFNYASADTAEGLAAHVGAKTSEHRYGWMTGKSMTAGVIDVLQPPEFKTLDFGHTQVNAGLLASFYEPGKFSNPDAKAAEVLYRAGVRNDFVDKHVPAHMKAVPMDMAVNPVTGEEFQVPAFPSSRLA